MTEQKPALKHTVIMEQRERLSVTGILDVISFDEDVVVAESELGVMIIKGINLHVSKLSLDNGNLDIDGEINSIVYEDKGGGMRERGSFLSKIFK